MQFSDARYTDAGHGQVSVEIDGVRAFLPADAGNPNYAAMLAAGVTIAAYSAPSPSQADVRGEYHRRLLIILEAEDLAAAAFIRADDADELARLNAGFPNLSATDGARRLDLLARRTAIETLIDKYNVLDGMTPIPVDYTADERWS